MIDRVVGDPTGERQGVSPPSLSRESGRTTAERSCELLNTENRKLKTSGEAETIGTTSNHPFWSVDRQEFVQAGSLEIRERLQTLSGDVKVVQQKHPRPGPEAVFNLEVHNEHVYFVGEDGVLVHNGGRGYTSGTSGWDRLDTNDLPGIATPLQPRRYSVLVEVEVDASILGKSRKGDFAAANKQLKAMLDADVEWATSMRKLLPDFENRRWGASPGSHVTWHHVPGTNRLQLVWRYQHQQSKLKGSANAMYQSLFHPNGRGGFADAQ